MKYLLALFGLVGIEGQSWEYLFRLHALQHIQNSEGELGLRQAREPCRWNPHVLHDYMS